MNVITSFQFNSIQFYFIYITQYYNNSDLKRLHTGKCIMNMKLDFCLCVTAGYFLGTLLFVVIM